MGSLDGNPMLLSGHKKRYRNTMLLLAIVAAMLSVLGPGIVLHKLRAGRALGLLLQDRERQLLTLHMILQKERAHSSEMKTKIEELKTKAVSLRTQKMQLKVRLVEAEKQAAHLKHKLASLKAADVEEASTKADLRMAALTDLMRQQGDGTEEVEHRLQQPAPAYATTLGHAHISVDGNIESSSNISETAGEGENIAADKDDAQTTAGDVKEAENNTGQEQGSERRNKWPPVRLETNVYDDDHKSADHGDGQLRVEEEDGGKGQTLSEEPGKGFNGEGIFRQGDQTAVGDELENQLQIDRTTDQLLLLNGSGSSSGSTTDGELTSVVRDDEVKNSNNTMETGVTVASDGEGNLEKKDNVTGDGEEKQTTASGDTQLVRSTRGRRSRRTRTKGRKRKTAARSWEQNSEALMNSQNNINESLQHDQSSKTGEKTHDQLVFDRNSNISAAAAGISSSVQVEPKLDQVQSEAADAVGYPAVTDAPTELRSGIDNSKDGFDGGKRELMISSSTEESNTSGGPDTREERTFINIGRTLSGTQ